MPITSVAKGSLFPAELVREMFAKVAGHSSIAKLANQIPISFAGNEIMTFSLDNEVELVAEGAAKSATTASVNAVTIAPVKVVYQTRFNDEFIKCAEEKQLAYLAQFSEGFAKKIARGIDIMAFHGINPYAGTTSSVIGANCLDRASNVGVEAYSSGAEESDITGAIADLAEGYTCTGIAMSPAFATALSATTYAGGQHPYEEFMWGGNPGAIRGIPCDVNSTVAVAASTAVHHYAYVGDFQNAFKWGYAENIPLEVIRYGDPDGQGDLKRYNQVLLRAEAYIGWGILDPTAFSRIGD